MIQYQLENTMNERVIYVPFNALLGYIRTQTSEGMKWRIFTDIHTQATSLNSHKVCMKLPS